MTRTTIDIDDELIARVMRKHHLGTKEEAVDFALRQVAGGPVTTDFLLSLQGTGWSGDLDEMRNGHMHDW